jgi:hypothetical protein
MKWIGLVSTLDDVFYFITTTTSNNNNNNNNNNNCISLLLLTTAKFLHDAETFNTLNTATTTHGHLAGTCERRFWA